MSELDAFETRFAVAYRRYLDKAPRGLDGATVARTAAAQPRGRWIVWPWTVRPWALRPAQVLVWIVLLALLLAMVAAGVFIGSQPRPLPAVVPPFASTAGYSAVSTGGDHTCAIRTDGGIRCWGKNYFGQAAPPEGTYVAVSAGMNHTCAIRTDRTLTCWGNNVDGMATPPEGTYTTVSAGSWHTCAIATNGILKCWGSNDYGEATAPPGTFNSVSAGQTRTCAIRTDGTLTCWGFENPGWSSPPTGTYLAVNTSQECAIRTDGTLACWGAEGPKPPPGTYVAVAGDWGLPCAIRTDGTLACWGAETTPSPPAGSYVALSSGLPDWPDCAVRTDALLICWGGGDWVANTAAPRGWIGGPPLSLISDMRTISSTGPIPASHRASVDFGWGESECGITSPSTTFTAGDTVHFAAHLDRVVGADEVVGIRLTVDGVFVEPDFVRPASRTFDAAGNCVGGVLHWVYAAPPWISFSAFPLPWQTGHYQLELLVDRQVVSRGEFDVAPGG